MSEQTTAVARPTGTVKYIELAQVVSAAAVGAMILPFVIDKLDYYGWWWTVLALTALAGALIPFSLARVVAVEEAVEQAEEDKGYYVVNDQRIATLEAILIPPDVLRAVRVMNGFGGTGREFRALLFDSIGEARGSEEIDRLYKYLRSTPPSRPPGPDQIPIR